MKNVGIFALKSLIPKICGEKRRISAKTGGNLNANAIFDQSSQYFISELHTKIMLRVICSLAVTCRQFHKNSTVKYLLYKFKCSAAFRSRLPIRELSIKIVVAHCKHAYFNQILNRLNVLANITVENNQETTIKCSHRLDSSK